MWEVETTETTEKDEKCIKKKKGQKETQSMTGIAANRMQFKRKLSTVDKKKIIAWKKPPAVATQERPHQHATFTKDFSEFRVFRTGFKM